MKIGEAFKLAGESILGSKMRSFLTMLGMIIGVASVIILVGAMQGVTNYIISTFSEMGTNVVTVSVTNTTTRHVDVDEMYNLAEEYDTIFEGVTPNVTGSYTVKEGSTSNSESVTGVGEDYLDLNKLTLSNGRFIEYADIKNRYAGCVIGTYIVDEYFGGKVTLGDTLKINGNGYTVIGVLDEQEDSTEGSADECIYIPYSCATRLAKSTSISSYTFVTKDTDQISSAETILDNYLYSIMKNEDLYTVRSMTELLAMVDKITSLMTAVLIGIAGISLLVAGIGIMNIMLVSVMERTKEIGIRKSLGARRRDIMWQFVIEAAAISSFGGILGIIIGIVVTKYAGNLAGVNADPPLTAILIAFGVSAGIGIGFGYMPASKAAKLNPIDALRTD